MSFLVHPKCKLSRSAAEQALKAFSSLTEMVLLPIVKDSSAVSSVSALAAPLRASVTLDNAQWNGKKQLPRAAVSPTFPQLELMAANPPIPSGMMCVASCRMPVSMPMPLVPLQPGYYMCFMLPAPAQYVHSIQSVHNAQVEEVPEKDSIVERFDLEDPGLDTTVEISAADVPTVDLLGAKVNSRAHGANKICDVDASFYTSDTETDVADAQSDAVLDAPPGLSLEAEPYRTPSELGLPPLLDRSAVELTRHGQMDVLDVADVEDADAPTLMPVSKCPSTWTLEETVSWMVGMEPALARCVPKLEENLIDGQVLQLLSEEDLISELGVPEHLCQAILDEIEKLFG
eukprot:Skav232084  [mRNA]  locus=scaffold2353:15707:21142:+ [translate_table: standard]